MIFNNNLAFRLNPGPFVQHGLVHVVALELALGAIELAGPVQRYPQWDCDVLTRFGVEAARRFTRHQRAQPWPDQWWASSRTRSSSCPGPSSRGSSPWRSPLCAAARGLSVQVRLLLWLHFCRSCFRQGSVNDTLEHQVSDECIEVICDVVSLYNQFQAEIRISQVTGLESFIRSWHRDCYVWYYWSLS